MSEQKIPFWQRKSLAEMTDFLKVVWGGLRFQIDLRWRSSLARRPRRSRSGHDVAHGLSLPAPAPAVATPRAFSAAEIARQRSKPRGGSGTEGWGVQAD